MPVFTPKQKTWTQSGPGAGNPRRYEMDYDPAEQLTGAVLRDMTDNVILKGYGYRYDDAGNRAGTQVSTPQAGGSSAVALTTDTSNTVNQLTSRAGGSGAMTFEGTVNEPANVTVGGQAAQVWKNGDNTFGFRAVATLAAGTNNVEIKATDAKGNFTLQHTNVTVAGAGLPELLYDANGNTVSDGARTYEWDAANQMVAIIYTGTGNRTEFTYDGAGRRVRMVEYTAGAAPVIRRFVWAGLSIVEERDANTAPVKRFYSQGFQTLNSQLSTLNSVFYSRDHLGSIRQHISATGTVLASYNYAPYGNLEVTTGPAPDFAYTGHLYHARSGLHLAPYRAYSAELGRWMNRDPIQEEGGINLYEYANANPIYWVDVDGLDVAPALANEIEKSNVANTTESLKHPKNNGQHVEYGNYICQRADGSLYPTKPVPGGYDQVARGKPNKENPEDKVVGLSHSHQAGDTYLSTPLKNTTGGAGDTGQADKGNAGLGIPPGTPSGVGSPGIGMGGGPVCRSVIYDPATKTTSPVKTIPISTK